MNVDFICTANHPDRSEERDWSARFSLPASVASNINKLCEFAWEHGIPRYALMEIQTDLGIFSHPQARNRTRRKDAKDFVFKSWEQLEQEEQQ